MIATPSQESADSATTSRAIRFDAIPISATESARPTTSTQGAACVFAHSRHRQHIIERHRQIGDDDLGYRLAHGLRRRSASRGA